MVPQAIQPLSAVRRVDPDGDDEVDLDDWTSYGDFAKNSAVWLIVSLEDLVSAFIALLVFVVLRLLGVVILITEVFVRKVLSAAFDFLESLWRTSVRTIIPPSEDRKENAPPLFWRARALGSRHSAVNLAGIPYIMGYDPSGSQDKLDRMLTENPGPVDQVFDLDLAKFFSMLTCAVYEGNAVHNELLDKWGFGRKQRRRIISENSCSCTVLHKAVLDYQVVVVVFKGTSPFDLNEWMSDARIKKVVDYTLLAEYGFGVSGLTPHGRVHEGFYNAFVKKASRRDDEPPLAKILAAVAGVVQAGKATGQTKVKLWVTGHSLGAALATMFTAIVAAPEMHAAQGGRRPVAGEPTGLEALCSALTGVYTFGNPRVGDRVFAEKVNAALDRLGVPFRRFRNGNDIVGIVPAGTGLLAELWQVWTLVISRSDVLPQIDFCSLTNWGEVGREYRLGYFGAAPTQTAAYPDRTPYERFREKATVNNAVRTLLHNILYWRAQKLVEDVVVSAKNCAATVWWLLPNAAVNLAKQRLKAPAEELFGGEDSELRSALLTLLTTLVTPSFIYDHSPSEYAKNIDRVRLSKKVQ
ncbi:Lipase [Diplonema papillatum]|nr:Lipase [Diplonema papillatum]